MKTLATCTTAAAQPASPIVRLAEGRETGEGRGGDDAGALRRARAFAEPLLAGQRLDTGEQAMAHADGVAAILQGIGAAPSMRAAAYLVYAGDYLQHPEEVVDKAFGASYAGLVSGTRKLMQIQRSVRGAQVEAQRRALQTERVRKMLLAFASDLRVVLLRLASRLQTLRWFAASRGACPQALAQEALDVFAPLANRLGIWQIKWELEDLAFRFLQPDEYHRVAALMDGSRLQREAAVEQARQQLAAELAGAGLECEVHGRPKHLYSVWKKMRGKGLDVARIFDLRALRVIVGGVPACYAALARVHELYTPVPGEFDDYIAKPKPNGYQSLHTVVRGRDGAALEVQIRTHAMHEHAEHGVAAHWAYKEAGARGYAGVSAAGQFEERVAEARRAVLRELLAWEREVAERDAAAEGGMFDDRIYVFTPQAAVIELTAGATPVDFAYALHTSVGHRCRGARVDGTLVPLHTPLRNGQTVEIIAAKDGGPSRDWLNAEPVVLKSPRARAKVRAWFNARQQAETIARGRELVDKLLQREGRTAIKLEDLAAQLGFKQSDALFEAVGKDEYSLHQIENLLRPPAPAPTPDELAVLRRPRAQGGPGKGTVLVVGVESLLTTLARCCRPAPPDAIGGFVTRGRGVAIHRADCSNLRHMVERAPERLITVAWGARRADASAVYAVDLLLEAEERPGLVRDVSELLAKEKMNVVGVHAQSAKGARGGAAWMTFTVELGDTTRLPQVLAQLSRIRGVRRARRK
ncbi:MAG TPA: bifunctional (p)ppGpp synthetase/guanosine-3',5'-bis(diphosphate) 3'-pyrophosphohydrolase [Rubrivivax sp.]|nr:bifunctional (p)ppGpp synthetase/guanosine-3',5'-bis(diphosphate) 3'-pyrophosphohydrolase [Rubrivivax sp.]